MNQIETVRHEAITLYLNARAVLHDMEPSSVCRPALQAKVDELELAAISMAVDETTDVDVPVIEVESIGTGSVALFVTVLVVGCSGWCYAFFVLARRWGL